MRHLPEARLPPPRGPVSASLFRYLLDLELERANRLRYCVSLVCLTPDLEDSEDDLGLTRTITRAALRQLRRTDLGTTLSRGVVGLLLVDTDPRMLAQILDRAANAGVPITAPDRVRLLHEASQLMQRARREGGDRLILPPLPVSI